MIWRNKHGGVSHWIPRFTFNTNSLDSQADSKRIGFFVVDKNLMHADAALRCLLMSWVLKIFFTKLFFYLEGFFYIYILNKQQQKWQQDL